MFGELVDAHKLSQVPLVDKSDYVPDENYRNRYQGDKIGNIDDILTCFSC